VGGGGGGWCLGGAGGGGGGGGFCSCLARSVGLLAAEGAIGLPFVGAQEDSTPTH